MAVGVFDVFGQLCECLAELRNPHHRIKPKAIAANRLAGDFAHHTACGNQRLGVLRCAHSHQGADQRGAPVGDGAHLLQQGDDVVVVAFGITKLGGVPGGVHARQAIKGINAQAGVVCHRSKPAVLCGMPCLGQGVFNKSPVRLSRLGNAQIGLAHQLQPKGRKHGVQLGQFAQVIGRQDDFHLFLQI